MIAKITFDQFLRECPHFEKTLKGGCWNKGEYLLKCSSRRGKLYRLGTVGVGVRIIWDKQLEWEK